MAGGEIDRLIQLLAKLPGLGPRSARRAALALVQKRQRLLVPLAEAIQAVARDVALCSRCGNADTHDPCSICQDPQRNTGAICVVEQIGDLWALERTGAHRGRYHVLGGTLSAIDGVGPDELGIPTLLERAGDPAVTEVILATNPTVAGQTTAHYVADRLADCDVTVTRLAHGVPLGGELDHLDDGTLAAALSQRR